MLTGDPSLQTSADQTGGQVFNPLLQTFSGIIETISMKNLEYSYVRQPQTTL